MEPPPLAQAGVAARWRVALPATDNFTGADGTNLTTYSGNWSLNNGNFRLFSNALRPLGTGSIECAARWNADTFNDNQYAEATFVGGSAGVYIGVACRISTSGADTYYAFYSDCTDDSYFFKKVAGAYTEFTIGDPVPAGSRGRIEANGTTIRILVDDVEWHSITDSAITSGAAGASGFDTGTGTRIDDWEGGDLGGTEYTSSVSGAMTPTGALARSPARALTGGGASAGALARSTVRALNGAIASSGTLVRSLARSLAGAVASAGALARTVVRALAGAQAPAGALARSVARSLTGAASSAGELVRAAQKPLEGVAGSSGGLATARAYLVNLAGALAPAGTLVRDTARALAGTAASTGVLVRSTMRALVGVLSSAGALARATGRVLSGTIAPAGALVRATARSLGGSEGSSGTLSVLRVFVRDLTGAMASAGALANTAGKTLAGAAPSAGALVRATVRDLAGALTPAGDLARSAARNLVSALGPTGAVGRIIGRALAGVQGAAGALVGALVLPIPLGEIRRVLAAVRRALVRVFRLSAVESVRRVAVREDDVQTINFSPKGAGETDFFTLGWEDYPLADGETISAIDSAVAAGGVTVVAEAIDDLNTTLQISGGTGGATARVEVQITTSAGRVLEREMVFRVIA